MIGIKYGGLRNVAKKRFIEGNTISSRQYDFNLDLTDGNNEDLIKKNKKRKPLGSIHFKICLRAMTKEEMNEVIINQLIINRLIA